MDSLYKGILKNYSVQLADNLRTSANDKFEIYAENGLEAFYVLDPAFIDRIETLSNNCKGKLLFCFIDNSIGSFATSSGLFFF